MKKLELPLYEKMLAVINKYMYTPYTEETINNANDDVRRALEDDMRLAVNRVDNNTLRIYLSDYFNIDHLMVLCNLPILYPEIEMVQPYGVVCTGCPEAAFYVVFRKPSEAYCMGHTMEFYNREYEVCSTEDLIVELFNKHITKGKDGFIYEVTGA